MRNYFRKQFDPTTDAKQMPEKGIALFFYLLRENALQLLWLDLLTLLLCIPVVTAPAAICAMNRVCGVLIRQGYVFLKDTYFKEFRQSFFRALPLGILFAAFLASGFISICYGIAFEGGQLAVFAKVFGFLEIGITFVLSGWSFVLISLQELPLGRLLQNSISMILLEPLCSLKLLAITGLSGAFVWVFFPYCVFALPVLPCLVQFSLCWVTREPVRRRIIDRAEAS